MVAEGWQGKIRGRTKALNGLWLRLFTEDAGVMLCWVGGVKLLFLLLFETLAS